MYITNTKFHSIIGPFAPQQFIEYPHIYTILAEEHIIVGYFTNGKALLS